MALKKRNTPVTVKWIGHGQPPVGAACEFTIWGEPSGPFQAVGEVIGLDGELAVLKYEGEYYARHERAMTPAMTEDEKLAQAREDGVKQLMQDAGISGSAWALDPESEEWAASAWDKGWRNVGNQLPDDEEDDDGED